MSTEGRCLTKEELIEGFAKKLYQDDWADNGARLKWKDILPQLRTQYLRNGAVAFKYASKHYGDIWANLGSEE